MPPPCIFGCTNYDHVHVFPDPNKFPDRFKTWVEIAGGKLETPEDYINYRRKKVCALHFTEKEKARCNRLTALAVPSLNIPKKVPATNYASEILKEERVKREAYKERHKKILSAYKVENIKFDSGGLLTIDNALKRPSSPVLKVRTCKNVYARRKNINHKRKPLNCVKMKHQHEYQQQDVKPNAVRVKFKCILCDVDIFGSFYVCVECENFNMCDTCATKNEHNEHYLLRIPDCKPYSDVQTVVDRLQKQLLNYNYSQSEKTNGDTTSDVTFTQSPKTGLQQQDFEKELEKTNPLFEGDIPDPIEYRSNLKDIKDEAQQEYDIIKEEIDDQVPVDCYTIETDNKYLENSISYTIVGLDNPVSIDSHDDDTILSSGEEFMTSTSNDSGASKRRNEDEESVSSDSNKMRFTYRK